MNVELKIISPSFSLTLCLHMLTQILNSPLLIILLRKDSGNLLEKQNFP